MAANNINQISTANTFEHWLIATQGLITTANLLTNGNGSTFYANTKLQIGGVGSSLNVVTSGFIETLYSNTINSNVVNSNVAIANSYIQFGDGTRQYTANAKSTTSQAAFDQANSANVLAQAAFDKANTATSPQAAFDKANSANVLAQAAFDKANTDNTYVSVTAGTYGNASIVPAVVVAANGRVTSIQNTTIAISATAVTGVHTFAQGGTNAASYTTGALLTSNGTAIISLANTGTAGTYGNSTYVPVITTDAYGRISSVTNTAISMPSGTASYVDDHIFGNGIDGDVTFSSGTTTLTRDMYYNNVTVTGTTTRILMNNYRIFVRNTMNIAGYTGTDSVFTTQNNYSIVSGGAGGYVYPPNPAILVAATSGSSGTSRNPGNGGSANTGGSGGVGYATYTPGYGFDASGTTAVGDGGSRGVVTNETLGQLSVSLIGANRNSLLSAGGASGSGGGGGGGGWVGDLDCSGGYYDSGTYNNNGGSGGSGGGGGGVLIIFANNFITGASTPSSFFKANGSNGSAGSAGIAYSGAGGIYNTYGGGGGGGGGGGAGWIFFTYKNKSGPSVTNLFSANGGSGGTGGASGGSSATAGGGGKGGNGGNIYTWDLSNATYTITTGSNGSANSGTTGGAGGSCVVTL
jgi:hypothetical protein